MREAIGAWAATSRAGRVRPGLDVMRTAVAVAGAIAELAARVPATADTVPLQPRLAAGSPEDAARFALTCPVAYDVRRLAELSGAGAREVERALAALHGAGVVARPHGERGPLALTADVLAPAPTVAAIAWPVVRERLGAVGVGVAAPCAVLRALAEQVGAGDDAEPALPGGAAAPVRISVRDLEAFTGFRRSAVSDAVAALVRARLLDADARAGHTGRFVLRGSAFGA
ncbi:MAG TPA: hypothetical protein VGD56_18045, partial [Gemmatirosa sp.]